LGRCSISVFETRAGLSDTRSDTTIPNLIGVFPTLYTLSLSNGDRQCVCAESSRHLQGGKKYSIKEDMRLTRQPLQQVSATHTVLKDPSSLSSTVQYIRINYFSGDATQDVMKVCLWFSFHLIMPLTPLCCQNEARHVLSDGRFSNAWTSTLYRMYHDNYHTELQHSACESLPFACLDVSSQLTQSCQCSYSLHQTFTMPH
jgi:hypothetical protein